MYDAASTSASPNFVANTDFSLLVACICHASAVCCFSLSIYICRCDGYTEVNNVGGQLFVYVYDMWRREDD